MRAQNSVLVLALSLAAAACGPAVQSATYMPLPEPRAESGGMMRIYEHTRPDCPFEELGRLSGWRRLPTHTPDDVANAMRRRAADMGGDAIIGFGQRQEGPSGVIIPISESASIGSISSGSVFVGTVIRFTDPECAGTAAAES
jgi:hypothetical protein